MTSQSLITTGPSLGCAATSQEDGTHAGQGGRRRLLCSLARPPPPHTPHEVWGWARSWGHLWALEFQEELAEAEGGAHSPPLPTPLPALPPLTPPPLHQTPALGEPPWIRAENQGWGPFGGLQSSRCPLYQRGTWGPEQGAGGR